jgi:hypothetical protein
MKGSELKEWVWDLEPDDEVVPVIDKGDDGVERVVLWVKDTPATPSTWLEIGLVDKEESYAADLPGDDEV